MSSTTRNNRIRFMTNNFGSIVTPTVTSEASGYPATNLFTEKRFELWKAEGNFTVTDDNNTLYVTDGAGSQTVTLTNGDYIASSLASHLKTQLDAGTDRTWTVTYSTSAYDFNLAPSASSTIELSNQTSAAWDMLGYAGTVDRTGTNFPADEVRIHTHEAITWDFTTPYEVGFVSGIVALTDTMPISASAIIKIQGSNVANWDTPPLDVSISASELGFMSFLDDQTTYQYRYWRLYIQDRDNGVGPQAVQIGHLYLGDYVTINQGNVQSGFTKRTVDLTKSTQSEGGVEYFRVKPKRLQLSNISLAYLEASDRRELEQQFHTLGISTPFFVSLDPTLCCSEELQELTKYVRFDREPTLKHVRHSIYTIDTSFKEVI